MNLRFTSILTWGIGACFFIYEYFLRVFVGTCGKLIIHDLSLSADDFSLVVSAYYITYSLMQLPVGFCIDYFGIKKSLILAITPCIVGVIMLSLAESFYGAFTARLLIGFGSSFGYVALIVIALTYIPLRYFSQMTGLAQLLGAVGPILGGAPLAYAVTQSGGNWRGALLITSVVGLALLLLVILFIGKAPPRDTSELTIVEPVKPLLNKLKACISNTQLLCIFSTCGLLYVALPMFAANWGATFLSLKGYSLSNAALLTSSIWIGYACSGPLSTSISLLIKRRKPILVIGAVGTLVISTAITFNPLTVFTLDLALFTLLGMCGGTSLMGYVLAAENTLKEQKPLAIALNNSFVMAVAAVIPPIASSFMSASSDIITLDSVRIGLSILPFTSILALISLYFVNETYCKEQNKVHISY